MTDKPNELSNAVTTVMAKLSRLQKGDRNAHGGYAYTSVDDIKDALRPLLASVGLEIRVNEIGWELQSLDTKSGKSVQAKFTFDIRLRHVSGIEDEPDHTTILLPHTGAQTTGAAKSYAIKEWLKARFLLSTGEKDGDADAIAPQDFTVSAPSESRFIYQRLYNTMRTTKTEAAYQEWRTRNEGDINLLDESYFAMLKQAVADHRSGFTEKPKEKLSSKALPPMPDDDLGAAS